MVKHRNTTDSGHFRKSWQKKVKTSFDAPFKKIKRRIQRKNNQKKSPITYLRPIVRCPTKIHNIKVKFGRGFSYNDLRRSFIGTPKLSSSGIVLDKRRRTSKHSPIDLKQVCKVSEFIPSKWFRGSKIDDIKKRFGKNYWRWIY